MIDWSQPIELDPPWTMRRLRGIEPEWPLHYIRTCDPEWRLVHVMRDASDVEAALGPDYLADWDDEGFLIDAMGRPCAPYIEDGGMRTLGLHSDIPNQYALALIR